MATRLARLARATAAIPTMVASPRNSVAGRSRAT